MFHTTYTKPKQKILTSQSAPISLFITLKKGTWKDTRKHHYLEAKIRMGSIKDLIKLWLHENRPAPQQSSDNASPHTAQHKHLYVNRNVRRTFPKSLAVRSLV